MLGPGNHAPPPGALLFNLKMLVFSALSPPVTTMSPLPNAEMPGQNMSWFVSTTIPTDEERVTGSKVAVIVRAGVGLMLNLSGWNADHVSTCSP
jgi:hypothetical protein